jgi:hypothetical protein
VRLLPDGENDSAIFVLGPYVLVASDTERVYHSLVDVLTSHFLELLDTTPSGISVSIFFKPCASLSRKNLKKELGEL